MDEYPIIDLSHLLPAAQGLARLPADERIHRLRADRWIGYPRAVEALNRLEALYTWPNKQRMPNLLLVGPTNNGKSMIVEKFRRAHPASSDADQEHIPVLVVQMPSEPSVIRFYVALLAAMGAPLRPRPRLPEMEQLALALLRKVGVRLLVIDELHNVLAGNSVNRREFLNLLRFLGNELRIPLESVRCTATDTSKVANTSATAASTGADLNGKAAQDAARKVRERLARCAARRHGGKAEDVRFERDKVHVNGRAIAFDTIVGEAYIDREQLWSDGFYATPGLSWDRETMTGNPFFYFAYGAAVSQVIVDTLTGEWKLERADVLHDVGRSLNPAVDIGQVEGAFIQGMGWLTMEELVWHPQTGLLMTHAPSTYKIPTANDCPADFRVRLFDNANVQDSIHRSKAVGEPPLLLPFSVLLAIRDAVSAVGGHKVQPPLMAPATSESILRAVDAVKRA